MKTQKKAFSPCKSLQAIKLLIQQNKQTFKCKDCGQLFTSNNKSVSDSNKEIWFSELDNW
jgi:transposase-like protein